MYKLLQIRNGDLARRLRFAPPARFAASKFSNCRNRLTPGETGFQLVPKTDLLLAQLPAKANIAAIVPADEVDEPNAEILQLATNLAQLVDVILQAFEALRQLLLNGRLIAGIGSFKLALSSCDIAMALHDVGDDALHERQRSVRLLEREATVISRRRNWFGGEELRAWHETLPFSATDGLAATVRHETACTIRGNTAVMRIVVGTPPSQILNNSPQHHSDA